MLTLQIYSSSAGGCTSMHPVSLAVTCCCLQTPSLLQLLRCTALAKDRLIELTKLSRTGAAWAALQWCKADVRCITFGSPRVGNRPFKQAFHSLVGTSFRCVHGRDPVPTLPPSMLCALFHFSAPCCLLLRACRADKHADPLCPC